MKVGGECGMEEVGCLGLQPQCAHGTHPGCPPVEAKGVNDEMSARHLGASRNTHQAILHAHDGRYMELPWLYH